MTQRPTGGGIRRSASKSSSVVTAARKLHQPSVRDAEQLFLADGPQSVEYGLRANLLERLFVSPAGDAKFPDLIDQVLAAGVEVLVVDDRVISGLSDTRTPQGLVGVARMPAPISNLWSSRPQLVIGLEQAQDPGNVGVVVRTADAAGADAVLLGPGSADPFGPKSVRASAGSVFRVPVFRVEDMLSELSAAQSNGLVVRGTAANGEVTLFSADDLDLGSPTLWLLGNEAHGLSELIKQECDQVVSIPMFGGAESLNVGIAAAICLYASAAAQYDRVI
ncbi:MAG TPA: RNA methyltransferase [Actinobacteria bacterium]|nr:RNA methyltransferase [Actinomycetota bacterium]